MPSITDNLDLYRPDAGQSGVAAQLNQNWTTLDQRFDEAAGHTHDGTEGEGPKLPVTSLAAGGTPSASTFLRGDGTWAAGGGAAGVTDHGELTGLGDDDHAQYYNQARGDTRYTQRANNLTDLANPSTARTNLGAAAAVHQHAAADITSGTIATSRLGTGTPSTSTFLRGDQTWAVPAGGGGSSTLDDLTDVLISSPADNQVLTYDSTSSSWRNETPASGGLTTEQVQDIVGAEIVGGTGISATYDDTAGTVTIASTGGGGAATDPVTTLSEFDDFLSGPLTSGQIGKLGWQFTNGTIAAIDAEANHPGIVRRSSSSTANQMCPLFPVANAIRQILPADTFSVTWIVRLGLADTETGVRVGLTARADSNPPSDGIYFEKLPADTAWFRVTRAGAVETRTTTGIAATGAWAKLRVRRLNASTIGFTIDGAAEQTVTATIPTIALIPWVQVWTSTANVKNLEIDLFALTVTGLSR
jgi:hypothetical protein